MSDKFKNLKEEYEGKKKALFEEMKKDFVVKSKEYFNKHPDVNSIGVPAYTPGFCDGDPCRWSLHDYPESVEVNGQNCDSELDDMEDAPEYGTPEYDAIEKKYGDACVFFNAFPNDFYEDTFEEGMITVFRDGKVEVQEYYHD